MTQLTESERLTLLHMREGVDWCQAMENVPPDRGGKSRPFRNTLVPLEKKRLALSVKLPLRPNGTRPLDIWWLTEAGQRARAELRRTSRQCKRGHDLTPDNLWKVGKAGVRCKICRQRIKRASRLRLARDSDAMLARKAEGFEARRAGSAGLERGIAKTLPATPKGEDG